MQLFRAVDPAVSFLSCADSSAHHVRPQYRRAAVSQPCCANEQEGRRQAGEVDRAHETAPVSHVQLVQLLSTCRPTALHRTTLLQGARRQVLLPHGSWSTQTTLHRCLRRVGLIGPIPWGHSGPLCHALSLSLSSTSMRRRRATVPPATSAEWA